MVMQCFAYHDATIESDAVGAKKGSRVFLGGSEAAVQNNDKSLS